MASSSIRGGEIARFASYPLFGYGFRPFFLLGSLYAAVSVIVWVPFAHGHFAIATSLPPAFWHGHEMAFGFAAAALAGFLLTAVPGWTGMPAIRGAKLAALVGLWLAARLAAWLPPLVPAWLFALIDLAFLPAVALVIAGPLLARSAKRNGAMLLLLALLTAANAAVHADALGLANSAPVGLGLTVNLFVLAIAIIGGRIVPAFTTSGLRAQGVIVNLPPHGPCDTAAIAAVATVALAEVVAADTLVLAVAAAIAALVNGARLLRWRGWLAAHLPLVWILHLGYAWLVLGLALKAMSGAGWVASSVALHALTAGAIGTMTLAVMTRASLGHTGRALVASRATVLAYALVQCGAVMRLAGPLITVDWSREVSGWGGIVWAIGFLVFVVAYAGVLVGPRVDGRPG
jgi:uncharacterized protein involved in response to NO